MTVRSSVCAGDFPGGSVIRSEDHRAAGRVIAPPLSLRELSCSLRRRGGDVEISYRFDSAQLRAGQEQGGETWNQIVNLRQLLNISPAL